MNLASDPAGIIGAGAAPSAGHVLPVRQFRTDKGSIGAGTCVAVVY